MIVYAVNIHTGGGKVLLDALIVDQPFGAVTKVYADVRYNAPKNSRVEVIGIKPTLLNRILAEFQLYRDPAFAKTKQVLFFGNLPPLFRSCSKINKDKNFILYLQNAFLIMGFSYPKNSLKELVRISIEKAWLHIFNSNIDEIWVQTKWMQEQTKLALNWSKSIKVAPFLPKLPVSHSKGARHYKFLYVGSLAKHKGLDIFLAALQNLDDKIFKIIQTCIVLDNAPQNVNILENYEFKNINIHIFNTTNREELFRIYENSEYLVCTSRLESFYLPIYEAHNFGCKIVLPDNASYSKNLPTGIKSKMYSELKSDLYSLTM